MPSDEVLSDLDPGYAASLLIEELYDVGVTHQGLMYFVPKEGEQIARLASDFGQHLFPEIAAAYRARYRRLISRTQIASALMAVEGDALATGRTRKLDLRCAIRPNGDLLIDSGEPGGAAYKVAPDGWKRVKPRRPTFYRTSRTAAFPRPRAGGSIDQLREFINVDDQNWPLLLAWIVAAFDPTIPRQIAWLEGASGAGKTHAARLLSSLIDPKINDEGTPPIRDAAKTWPRIAASAYLLFLENYSRITEAFSNSLCTTGTGGTVMESRLYSNGELVPVSYKRVMILTTTGTPGIRGDLARRIVKIECQPLTDTTRREARELDAEFTAARPELFGAVLDLLVKVQAIKDEVEPFACSNPDFGRYAAAISEIVGGADTLRRQLIDNEQDVAASVIAGSPFLTALTRAVRSQRTLVGSAHEILDSLSAARQRNDDSWPETAEAFVAAVHTSRPQLEMLGISAIRLRRTHSGRAWRFSVIDDEPTRPR